AELGLVGAGVRDAADDLRGLHGHGFFSSSAIDRRVPRLTQIPGQPDPPGRRPPGCPFQPRCSHTLPEVCGTEIAAPLRVSEPHTTACVRAHEIALATEEEGDPR
ncbi:hypothetical protein AB0K74_41400, partial [Streptomyces sp. NPDC056159]